MQVPSLIIFFLISTLYLLQAFKPCITVTTMKVAPNKNSRSPSNGVPLNLGLQVWVNRLHYMPLPTLRPYTMVDEGSDCAHLGEGWVVVRTHAEKVIDHQGNKKRTVDCVTTIVTGAGTSRRMYMALESTMRSIILVK
jgi:hypothetical protein